TSKAAKRLAQQSCCLKWGRHSCLPYNMQRSIHVSFVVLLTIAGFAYAEQPRTKTAPDTQPSKAPRGTDFKRRTIYHSPQTPGYTCWVGAWQMPDGSLMATFKQATGPLKGRPRLPELLKKIGMEREPPERDFTGLELANIFLRSTDGGQRWQKVAEEPFPG